MGLKHRLDAIEKKVIPKETVKIKVTLCESMPPREEMARLEKEYAERGSRIIFAYDERFETFDGEVRDELNLN